MNRLLPAALLSCAAASLSSPAWSFQGFDFFQQIEHSIECVRKPGTDMLVCSNKFVPADDEEEETTPEPVVEPTPEPEPPKTYFELVDNAFPDQTPLSFFFTDTSTVNETIGALSHLREVDIDDDGVSELIQIFTKQVPNDGASTSELEESQVVAWDYQDTGFVNVTAEYFGETDMACMADGMESKNAEIDLNQDGQIDFFYSCNHEDGALRLAKDGGYHAQLVGFISQFDGKYKMYKFGDQRWWHSVGVGMDEDGVPFVHAAGYVPDGTLSNGRVKYTNNLVQNERYYYDYNSDEMVTVNSDNFPDIQSGYGGPLEIARYYDFTDLLIQRPAKLDMQDFARENNWEWPLYALQAYYLDEPYGRWQRSEMFEMDYERLGEIDYVSWDGDLKRREILDIDGYVAIANAGGLDPMCELTLYPNQEPVILTTMSIEWIPDWAPDVTFIDQTVEGSENANLSVQKYYLMDFQNQEITNLGDLEIDGESPAFGGKELNHLGPQCTDVNQDGYDDIVMGYFWWNDYRYDYPDDREGLVWETNKQIKVLINQQDGTFSTLDIPSLEDLRIKQIQTGFKAGSITGDYNGDGILDVVTYYSSVGNYLGPNSLEMNFYKGTAKILEAQ
jgi:hypothetical protein